MDRSQIRQNKASNQWVIFAPARGKRPQDFASTGSQKESLPEYAADCPFCHGNEHLLTQVVLEIAGANGLWQTRVVQNKYPAVTPSENTRRSREDIYLSMAGHGHHEVIIESRKHNDQVASMSVEAVARIIETYHRRYVDILREAQTMMALIFRNHGPRAGTSLIHPHSQLIALGWVPGYIRWREDSAERYYDRWGHCVYCDIMEYETRDRRRHVYENESFVAFVPFAAEVPFEVWIMPRSHQADFGDISEIEKADLADALHRVLGGLHNKLNDPDYNYIVNTAARHKSGEPHLHWYVQVRPRLTTQAGFEIGSGISINPSLPEDDAQFLRGTSI